MLITDGIIYSLTQTLVDRVTSTYNNTLTIEASFVDTIGEYSCNVTNSIGTSSAEEIEIKGNCLMCFNVLFLSVQTGI